MKESKLLEESPSLYRSLISFVNRMFETLGAEEGPFAELEAELDDLAEDGKMISSTLKP